MDWSNKLKELQAPFNWSDIKWRIGSTTQNKDKGQVVAYVSARAIQNRLDNVFGAENWKVEYKAWRERAQLCGISVYHEERKEWITKWDGADNTKIEGTKGGLSDSMKRAAIQWGIGRYLYDLPSAWVEIEPQGKSFKIKKGCTPQLPEWAYSKDTIKPTHASTLTEKVAVKGLTEDKICAKYFKETYAKLTIEEFKQVMKLLDKYEDVKAGEEPVLKQG